MIGPAKVVLLAMLAGAGCSGCARHGSPSGLSIAAAADLRFALEDGARQFHMTHPEIDLRIAYDSSGNFYSQIQNHAPFDVFLSADQQYPRRLAREGFAREDAIFVYALGRLAVWVAASSGLDPSTALRDVRVRHIAIANPQHAPYGRAAESALRSMGIYDSVAKKLVFGENISQTLQFVESGAADAGIVALSLAAAPAVRGHGRFWEIPADTYAELIQSGVILKDTPAARQFRAWWLGPAGRTLLRQYGFSLPGE
jgi:molybdate transport system substrate-binding protein